MLREEDSILIELLWKLIVTYDKDTTIYTMTYLVLINIFHVMFYLFFFNSLFVYAPTLCLMRRVQESWTFSIIFLKLIQLFILFSV